MTVRYDVWQNHETKTYEVVMWDEGDPVTVAFNIKTAEKAQGGRCSMPLVWTRTKDSEHYGKPVYEYNATDGDRRYCIVWASDYGGTFGYTARNSNGPLTSRSGIVWGRRLKCCKEACEAINQKFCTVPQNNC